VLFKVCSQLKGHFQKIKAKNSRDQLPPANHRSRHGILKIGIAGREQERQKERQVKKMGVLCLAILKAEMAVNGNSSVVVHV